jgi:hypothetical protein
MMKIRSQLRKSKLLASMASLKITVLGLCLLFTLTFWGTIAQVQNGLYLAQDRFFHSFFFLAGGFFPFPGAQLVMWVLFFNLISVMLVRFAYTWKRLGILIIHFGLLLFLISSYVILHCAQESHLTLKEGEASNVSTAFHFWELAIWEHNERSTGLQSERDITSIDIARLSRLKNIDLVELGLTIHLKEYFRNAHAFTAVGKGRPLENASGIGKLEPVKLEIEPEKNNPGVILEITIGDNQKIDILLYGEEVKPTQLKINGKSYNFSLRLMRYPLPITLKLLDFVKEEHPGTTTARSYKSLVAIETNGAWREKLIYMNNPLRYKNYTLYQSSFAVDRFNNEISTLAVVKNSGRWLPYIATFITFAGLVLHFVMMAFNSRERRKKA